MNYTFDFFFEIEAIQKRGGDIIQICILNNLLTKYSYLSYKIFPTKVEMTHILSSLQNNYAG
jgi:hypothetical protein